jgi:hypothetical protein
MGWLKTLLRLPEEDLLQCERCGGTLEREQQALEITFCRQCERDHHRENRSLLQGLQGKTITIQGTQPLVPVDPEVLKELRDAYDHQMVKYYGPGGKERKYEVSGGVIAEAELPDGRTIRQKFNPDRVQTIKDGDDVIKDPGLAILDEEAREALNAVILHKPDEKGRAAMSDNEDRRAAELLGEQCVMQWRRDLFSPTVDATDDYRVLEWCREHWNPSQKWDDFKYQLHPATILETYTPGMWTRAALAVAGNQHPGTDNEKAAGDVEEPEVDVDDWCPACGGSGCSPSFGDAPHSGGTTAVCQMCSGSGRL